MQLGKFNSAITIAAVTMSFVSWAGATVTPTGGPIAVPSGIDVRWLETLSDNQGPAGLTMRFRFVAPDLARSVAQDQLGSDMDELCNGFALSRIPSTGPRPAQIVIAIADRGIPFGDADPSIHQYFEAYSVNDGTCTWEFF